MKKFLILATLLLAATLAAQHAPQTQKVALKTHQYTVIAHAIDLASYHVVESRSSYTYLNIYLPSVGFGSNGQIHVLVIAAPYSVRDEQHIRDLIDALGKIVPYDIKTLLQVVQILTNFRNVFFPYEPFKVGLGYVIFVDSMTLLDFAIEAISEMATAPLSSGGGQSATLFFVPSILYFMLKNWENNQSHILRIQDVAVETLEIESIYRLGICTTEKIENAGVTSYCVEMKNNTCVRYRVEIDCQCKTTHTVKSLEVTAGYLTYSVTSTYVIETDNLTKVETDCKKITGNLTRKRCHLEIRRQGNDLERRVANSVLKYTLPTSVQLDAVFTGIDEKVRGRFTDSLTGRLTNHFAQSRVMHSFTGEVNCGEDSVKREAQNWAKETVRTMIRNIYTQLHTANALLNKGFENSFKSDVSSNMGDKAKELSVEIAKVAAKGITSYALSCATTVAKAKFGKLVASIPAAGALYAAANGIFGALQRQVTIEGEVETEGLFVISSTDQSEPICSRNVKTVRLDKVQFESKPGTEEAVYNAVVGFLAGIAKTIWGDVGKLVDLVPIVREMEFPGGSTYLMAPSTPGVYNITIRLSASNLVTNTIKNIKASIQSNIQKTYKEVMGNGLLDNIAGAIHDAEILKSVNPKDKYNITLYDMGGDKQYDMELSVSVFVIPPLPFSPRATSDAVYYEYAYDIFGLVRSHIYRTGSCSASLDLAKLVETACWGSGRAVGGLVTNRLNYHLNLSSRVTKHVEEWIDKRFGEREGCSPTNALKSVALSVTEGVVSMLIHVFGESLGGAIGLALCPTSAARELQSVFNTYAQFYCSDGHETRNVALSAEVWYVPSYATLQKPTVPRSVNLDRLCSGVVVGPYFVRKDSTSGRAVARLVPTSGAGINLIFSSFKVYPVVVVSDVESPLNPYYMAIPFSAPSREFFVLGSVEDVIIVGGGGLKKNKPFVYVDVKELLR